MQVDQFVNAYWTPVVCVDSCERGVLWGWLYNSRVPERRGFGSLMELLLSVENLPLSRCACFSARTPAGRAPSLGWKEGDENFRSALELIFLMDRALWNKETRKMRKG